MTILSFVQVKHIRTVVEFSFVTETMWTYSLSASKSCGGLLSEDNGVSHDQVRREGEYIQTFV